MKKFDASSAAPSATPARPARPLRLGFVPLADSVPLVMAHELGLFRRHGLRVVLSRELGWATIRDKIIHGELDAAHALAAMPAAATLGIGCVPCDCLTALVLNLHGNAITLSDALRRRGVSSNAGLREEITRSRPETPLSFGVVSLLSSHHYVLRKWLAAAGIQVNRDVRIVVAPPPQMAANLKAGHLDGFCVGEPWNSVAAQEGTGWCAAVSAELEPGHPEKVLMVRREFAEKRPAEHLALVAALVEACAFCDASENHARLAATMARPDYVGASAAALRRSFHGELAFGPGLTRRVRDFCVFHRDGANEPTGARTAWVLELIRAGGLCPDPAALPLDLGNRVFRPDLFARALALPDPDSLPPTNLEPHAQAIIAVS